MMNQQDDLERSISLRPRQDKSLVYKLYEELLNKHGPPEKLWPEWCAEEKSLRLREIIAMGAVLTQRTSWRNADLALRNLKRERLLSLERIAKLKSLKRLTELVRPAGFYQTKPKRLCTLASFVVSEYGGVDRFMKENLKVARTKLLSLYGIGPETADVILLYALDKPSFVIDEYTRRLVNSKGLTKKTKYEELKEFFENRLPRDVKIYQNYHALIIVEQKGREQSLMKRLFLTKYDKI